MVDVREPSAASHREQCDVAPTNGSTAASDAPVVGDDWRDVALLVGKQPRVLVESDAEWLVYLCKKRYSHRYDQYGTEQWFRNIVLKQPGVFLALRTQNAFMIALIAFIPWLPAEPECNVAFMCCDDGAMFEGISLLKASVEWARFRRCKRWRMSSDTEYDFAPLARRIGATEISPRFVVEF